ncbi:C6 transcription factor [Aspergillus sclerotioniger CBS 115572]|uniref:C6 transcription factor n=1 Tax=Aspergillus sclerotioniger CBS 115572 TaxID=1450535 RepID=A0A317V7A8_9EURO|nr:C6 transcription factor [Aspergillus sclerotioniger CBS 115572]PWY68938.1 C6 transcription factor [Aspergillus sclerotioniger CBS 115572]
MRHRLTKRACDECISRKVKCSGAWPCETCQNAPKQVNCTYLKPARRRGPKVRRYNGVPEETVVDTLTGSSVDHGAVRVSSVERGSAPTEDRDCAATTIPMESLASVVRLYQRASYSVWPVVNAEVLLEKLEGGTQDVGTLCLAMALCAATMAQLELAPIAVDDWVVDSAAMASECMRMREANKYREHLDKRSILVSFFLHVYHAKINKRNSAMMFIQEAVSGARLLKLDEGVGDRDTSGVVANEEIMFLLLWVSERGWAMHVGLEPSYSSPLRLPDDISVGNNADVKGLLELARLFATFDGFSSARRNAGGSGQPVMTVDGLAETESVLSMLSFGQGDRPSTRIADYCITKAWMRTIIWQEALSRHLLSSKSYTQLMTFKFPAVVSRDLLKSLQGFTESDLLPLGRDQLLKCFEIANSLADTVLFTSSVSAYPAFQLGPQDFLHALYQKLLPFLEQDPMLKSILHTKTADALVKAPARLLSMEHDHWSIDDEDIDHPVEAHLDSPEQNVDPQWILYEDQFDECIVSEEVD